jgi:hypothetical protein
MSRGFDWFELDDSSGSGFDSEREIGGGSSSNANERLWRQHIRREEERTDKLDRESRDRTDKERPQPPREERVQVILADRFRTRYSDRERQYSLRDSEIHLLSEVGKFRVVAVNDLVEFAYNGDRARVENDNSSLAARWFLQAKPSITGSRSPKRPFTTRTSTGSITRLPTRSKAAAAESSACGLTTN